jgi:hypothetical protein
MHLFPKYSQEKRKSTALPPRTNPALLHRRHGMAQVVMVINRMAIAEVPIVWARVLEFPLDIPIPLRAPPLCLSALIGRSQWPPGCHHPHHIIRLLHPPNEIRHIFLHPSFCINIPNLHLLLVKPALHCITWDTNSQTLPFVY